jgi:hypothetical protein
MKKSIICKIVAFSITILLLSETVKVNAIPAFARKYQISCQVCHAPAVPRLKGFGEEFASNGFRMKEYESPRYFIQTGDDRLSLFRELPVAIRFDGHAMVNYDNSGKTDFAAPYILKLLSGGELSDKISYYFYFLMNEGGSIVGVEDAFLQFNDIFKTGITFYAGQFQASDPLAKSELRYTFEEYKIFDAAPGNSSARLKYERGIILERSFNTGTTFQFQVLNGCGIEKDVFDTDKHKNFMFRVSQGAGKNLSLGLFLYTGKEDLRGFNTSFTSNITMFGPDVKLNFSDKFVMNLQYLRRSDSDVYLEENGSRQKDVITQGGFAELIYSPKGDMSKWYLTGLVNYIKSDIKDLDYTSATFHAGYLVRRNLRLVSEFTYQFSDTKHGRVNAGFVSAF